MKWHELWPKSRGFIRSACIDIKRKDHSIENKLDRIAVAIESPWAWDKIATLTISFIAVLVALGTALMTVDFLSQERADRLGSVFFRAYIARGDQDLYAVMNKYKNKDSNMDNVTVYNCTMDEHFNDCTLFLVWESENTAAVSIAYVKEDLGKYKYEISASVDGDNAKSIYIVTDSDNVDSDNPYGYVEVNNATVLAKISKYVRSDSKSLKLIVNRHRR